MGGWYMLLAVADHESCIKQVFYGFVAHLQTWGGLCIIKGYIIMYNTSTGGTTIHVQRLSIYRV
jgi:hypothetical protein